MSSYFSVFTFETRRSLVRDAFHQMYPPSSFSNLFENESGLNIVTRVATRAVEIFDRSLIQFFDNASWNERRVIIECSSSVIRQFVRENAYFLKKLYDTGFPFSLFDIDIMERAVTRSLIFKDTNLLAQLIFYEPTHQTQEALRGPYTEAVMYIKIPEIRELCVRLLLQRQNRTDYYCLWVIKKVGGCAFGMPAGEFSDRRWLREIFHNYCRQNAFPKHIEDFVKILCFQSSRYQPLYLGLIKNNLSEFFHFIIKGLHTLPREKRAKLILEMLRSANRANKQLIGRQLLPERFFVKA